MNRHVCIPLLWLAAAQANAEPAPLLPGIARERDIDTVTIVLTELATHAAVKKACYRLAETRAPATWHAWRRDNLPVKGCALLQRDAELGLDGRSVCKIIVKRGDRLLLEHELAHCIGLDHPRPYPALGKEVTFQ